ncbi:MAG: hypothetical protein QM627_08100 [Luteolibacter sp.]
MISESGKTVALIDPLWVGHHPLYFGLFAAAFLRAGAHVIGLCPDPEAARSETRAMMPDEDPAEIDARFHLSYLPPGKRSFFNGRFEGDPVRTFQRWKRAADRLEQMEIVCQRSADFVFFPYLDSYLRFLPFSIIPDLFLNRPWSGLYLRNHHLAEKPSLRSTLKRLLKGDPLLRSRFCTGLGVLDERIIPHLSAATGKRVELYPDVTFSGLPDEPAELAKHVLELAAGRKIVGMIGLERRKGVVSLLKTAELAHRKKLPLYFVCAGALHLSEFSPAEQAWLKRLSAASANGKMNNLHFRIDAKRLPDEVTFNSLFSTFDIAWVAYENFQGSSGALGKAAAFEIPCVATAGECIGHRVETYRMGLTLDSLTPENALYAIERLADGKNHPLIPDYAGYRAMHSQARLDELVHGALVSPPALHG